ncbi:MAG TPA: hypothetical protein VIL49_12285 [Capillimicrobium sp.]
MPLAAALAALALTAPAPADGLYRGDGVALTVRDGAVVRVRARVPEMLCDPFGDIGPLRIVDAPAAPVGGDGRVRFTVGPPSERLTLAARFGREGRARGRLRVRGTIGTGDPCRSPRQRFVLGLQP